MSLTNEQRRALITAGRRLKPAAVIAAEPPSEAAVAHVRTCLRGHELVKIRVHAENAAACEAVALELARQVPCEFIQRIGHVVLLFRAEDESD